MSRGMPPLAHEEIHMDSYSLPQASRIPKVMIAGVAGFILLTTALYYLFKWLCTNFPANGGVPTREVHVNNPTYADSSEEMDIEKSIPIRSKVQVKNIPEIGYDELQLKRCDSEEMCAVCLTEFSKGDKLLIKMLPACNHAFHSACIDLWLFSHASCPVCRAHL